MSEEEKVDYSKTLNLPQTEFPMRGNLPEREPYFLKKMHDNKVYQKALDKNIKSGKKFILHDGPPYANGNIHMGHALNKILKDIVVRYKTMNGFYSPYVPGWDTHGLPIEKKVQIEKKITKDDVGEAKFREICREYAMDAIKNQAGQFERLGGLGDYYKTRYLTLYPEFEANQIQVFWDMFKQGYIYRDLKPVYWCSDCETALAEAEIEYADHDATSIYVKFRVKEDSGKLSKYGDLDHTYILIWTTTPWTLPGNQAITVNKDYSYAIVEVEEEKIKNRYVIAKDLVETVMSKVFVSNYKIVGEIKGEELEGIICYKPLDFSKTSIVILGSDKDLYVSLDTGTGCVHTAPGHGHEDYLVCKRYKDIEITVPVDKKGKMTKDAGKFEGLTYSDANKKIIEYLETTGFLFAKQNLKHSYPHCWRCKKPVIYRAETQWFASVAGFKDKVLEEIKNVKWIPDWGYERMANMIKDRSDWCISRQRVWGVPIPIFYCKDCGKELITEKTIEIIKKKIEVSGSNMWYELTPEQILQGKVKCACGGSELVKEKDIMDVWFDSGTTYASVLSDKKYGIEVDQADMYLEGNDQYRGWFQSSLLTSVATKGKSPYKQVLTHGWVVDGEGRKMSKSLGNGVDPLDIVKDYGADILRLWTISSDYHNDVRISKDILSQVSEVYKKIRNTVRFLLGNIYDFNPAVNMVEYSKRDEIDRYIMSKVNRLIQYVDTQYENYDYHLIYSELHRFCTSELSSRYLDIIKDRLYVLKADHELRRSSQSTMYDILRVFVKLIAPVLSFTADEIWSYMWHVDDENKTSVLLADFPTENIEYNELDLIAKWDKIFEIKDRLAKDIEQARVNKLVGHSLDSKVEIHTSGEEYSFMKENIEQIKLAIIVSQLEVSESSEYKVIVDKAFGDKCARCWTYSMEVGRDKKHRHLCKKCIENI
ncbi:MAG: isoleucine--tRNA ligase [Clostridia bacterium]|nr:isoleucine--tRNA ligase [Clostridia bacterium]